MYFLCISLGIQNVWLSYQKNKYIYIYQPVEKKRKKYIYISVQSRTRKL